MKSANKILLMLILFVGDGKCDDEGRISYPKEVEFLDVPQSFREYPYELKDGKIFWDSGLKSMPLPQRASDAAHAFTGDGQYILGAPAIVFKAGSLDVKDIIQDGHGIARATEIENNIFIVIEKRVIGTDGMVISRFEIFSKRQEAKRISVIIRTENHYNEFLTDLWMVDSRTIAMVTSSGRHPYINTLLLIDANNGSILGIRGFGTMRYFPDKKAFRFTKQIDNCENLNEILNFNEKHSQTIQMRENGEFSKILSRDLQGYPFRLSE
jgi:hypothetical protein